LIRRLLAARYPAAVPKGASPFPDREWLSRFSGALRSREEVYPPVESCVKRFSGCRVFTGTTGPRVATGKSLLFGGGSALLPSLSQTAQLTRLSKFERVRACRQDILFAMAKKTQSSSDEHLEILSAERDGKDGILVRFSDGTITGYVVEELLSLRPIREEAEEPKAESPLQS